MSALFRSSGTRLKLHPLRRIHVDAINVKNPVQMRASGPSGSASVTKNIATFHGTSRTHQQSRHVQVHGFQALPMIDSRGVAEHIELFCEGNRSRSNRANRFSFRCALVHATVIFAGVPSVVQTFDAERRGD